MLTENQIDDLFEIAQKADMFGEELLSHIICSIFLNNSEHIVVIYKSKDKFSYSDIESAIDQNDVLCRINFLHDRIYFIKDKYLIDCYTTSVFDHTKPISSGYKNAKFVKHYYIRNKDSVYHNITIKNVDIVCDLWYKLHKIIPNYIEFLNDLVYPRKSKIHHESLIDFYNICKTCIYYTEDSLIWCAVNPSIADTIDSQYCRDFDSK